MALTGVIHILTDIELQNQIDSNFEKLNFRHSEYDISYYLIDFLEVLQSYSSFDKQEFRQILEGKNNFQPMDGFIGYSFSNQVVETVNQIIDKISIDTFNGYLQQGLAENHIYCNLENNKILMEYYTKIKSAYEKAQNENKALIFRIG
jgi:hypothetical protein